MSECQCNVCLDAHEYMRIISELPSADKEWMEKFYDNYCNEMLDANVNETIIDGTWQNADEIIAYAREKITKKIRNKNGYC